MGVQVIPFEIFRFQDNINKNIRLNRKWRPKGCVGESKHTFLGRKPESIFKLRKFFSN